WTPFLNRSVTFGIYSEEHVTGDVALDQAVSGPYLGNSGPRPDSCAARGKPPSHTVPARPGNPANLRADASKGESCARKHRVSRDEPDLAGRHGGWGSGCGGCGGQPVAGSGAVRGAAPACLPLVRRRGR